jgi:hypothetical protein
MPWKFDPFEQDVFWVQSITITEGVGDITMGDSTDADISIDLGSRDDSPSQIDQGMRVYDGDV